MGNEHIQMKLPWRTACGITLVTAYLVKWSTTPFGVLLLYLGAMRLVGFDLMDFNWSDYVTTWQSWAIVLACFVWYFLGRFLFRWLAGVAGVFKDVAEAITAERTRND